MTGVAVLALVCFAGSDGVSIAQDTGPPDEDRLAQSTEKPATDETGETSAEYRGKTSDTIAQGLTRPSRQLTTRQKRIFVLGLGTGEKN